MIKRSRFLQGSAMAGLLALTESAHPLPAGAASAGAGVSPDDALTRLMAGNRAFVAQMGGAKVKTIEERAELANGQAPWASILACADSRVTPEILFNVGLGDIFVSRDAGNVSGGVTTASLEYGAAVLGSQLIMVLGHSACGAVKATISASKGEPPPTPDLVALTNTIMPAVTRVKGRPGDLLENATKANVSLNVYALRENPLLAGLIAKGKLKIVAAYVELTTGVVSLL